MEHIEIHLIPPLESDEIDEELTAALIRPSICEKPVHKVVQACSLEPQASIPLTLPNKVPSSNLISLNTSENSMQSTGKSILLNQYKLKKCADLKKQLIFIKESANKIKSITSTLYKTVPSHLPSGKTILLGLEETIIHTLISCKKSEYNQNSIPLTGKYSRYSVIKRPYLDVFIAMLSKYFSIYVLL
jgi:hypothetical protein